MPYTFNSKLSQLWKINQNTVMLVTQNTREEEVWVNIIILYVEFRAVALNFSIVIEVRVGGLFVSLHESGIL